jgi:hypothetical protein
MGNSNEQQTGGKPDQNTQDMSRREMAKRDDRRAAEGSEKDASKAFGATTGRNQRITEKLSGVDNEEEPEAYDKKRLDHHHGEESNNNTQRSLNRKEEASHHHGNKDE